MGRCISSACYNSVEWLLSEFELGYDHPNATSEGFVQELVDCENTVPDDWPVDAGLPLKGSACYLKCKGIVHH